MKTLLFTLAIFLALASQGFCANTPPPGSNGQIIYNNNGQYGAESLSNLTTGVLSPPNGGTGVSNLSLAEGVVSNQWTGINIIGDQTSYNRNLQPIHNGWGGLVARQMNIGPSYYVINDNSHFDCDVVESSIMGDLISSTNTGAILTPNTNFNSLNAWLPSPADATWGGSPPNSLGGHLADFLACHLGGNTWLAIPQEYKVYAQSAACTWDGTWSASASYGGTFGEASSTNGGAGSCPITTTGNPVYLWYQGQMNNGGTFTWSLDNTTTGTATVKGNNAYTFPSTTAKTLVAIRIPPTGNLASGSHTIGITLTSTTTVGNTVTIEGIGTPSQGGLSAQAPAVVIGGTIPDATYTTASAVLNSGLLNQSLQLIADGLRTPFANVPTYWNASTDRSTFSSSSDINNTGMTHIAQAFTQIIQPVRSLDGTINPLDFGAAANALFFPGAYCTICNPVSTTANSNVISIANYTFQPGIATRFGGGDVGKKICIAGGGNAGAASVNNVGPCTCITSVNTANNTATVARNLPVGVTGGQANMGGYPSNPNDPTTCQDDTVFTQNAAMAAILNGGKVHAPTHLYVHDLFLPQNISFGGNAAGQFYLTTNEDLGLNPQATIIDCALTGYPDDTQDCIRNVPHVLLHDFMMRTAGRSDYTPVGISAACIGYSTNSQSGPSAQILTDNISYFGCPIGEGEAYGYNQPVTFTGSISGNTMTVSAITSTNFYAADHWTFDANSKDFLGVGRPVSGPGVTSGTIITVADPGGQAGTYTLNKSMTVTSTGLTSAAYTGGMELRDWRSQAVQVAMMYNGDFSDSKWNETTCTSSASSCFRLGPALAGFGNGGNNINLGRSEEATVSAVTCDGCGVTTNGHDFNGNGGPNVRTLGTHPYVQVTGGAYGGAGCNGSFGASTLLGGAGDYVDITGAALSTKNYGSCGGGLSSWLFMTATGATPESVSVNGGEGDAPYSVIGKYTVLYNWINGTPKRYRQSLSGYPLIDTSQAYAMSGALNITSSTGGASYFTGLSNTTTNTGTITISGLGPVMNGYDCAGGDLTTGNGFSKALSGTTTTACALSITTTVTSGDSLWFKAPGGN